MESGVCRLQLVKMKMNTAKKSVETLREVGLIDKAINESEGICLLAYQYTHGIKGFY